VDYGTNAFVMRLVKQGNMYSILASTNGTDFAAITNVPAAAYANLVPKQLGFWMGLDPNQTDTMLIDYFEVSTTSPPDPIAAWLASFGLTGTTLVEQVGAAINNGDGTETVRVHIKQAITGSTQKFMRLVLLPTP
jgi:hypothetical protein